MPLSAEEQQTPAPYPRAPRACTQHRMSNLEPKRSTIKYSSPNRYSKPAQSEHSEDQHRHMPSENIHSAKNYNVPANRYGDDVESILIDEASLRQRIRELAEATSQRYKDAEKDLILICVLKGAVFFITDFAREMSVPTQLEFMAVSSYGNSTSSSGVVRILKDLDRDIRDHDVVIVEDIIDSGLTLSWLMKNLRNRQPRSLSVVTLLRKPDAVKVDLEELTEVGFDIPNEFVVGYGLDFAERYRDLPFVGTLRPSVYQ